MIKPNRKILIFLTVGLLIISLIIISVLRYKNAAEQIVFYEKSDGTVTILEEAAEIGNKTIEFAAQFRSEDQNEFVMALYDPRENNLYTTDVAHYDKYTLTAENGMTYMLSCVSKCKQFLIYFAEGIDEPILSVTDKNNNTASLEMDSFEGDYNYFKTEQGITLRALYCTQNSSVLLYDVVLEKDHPLLEYMRSGIKSFSANAIYYHSDSGDSYTLLIGGDGGTLLPVNSALCTYIPSGFCVFRKNPDDIEGTIQFEDFSVKYYISIFHPLAVSKAAKNAGMIYDTKLVESIVWENEVTQFVE